YSPMFSVKRLIFRWEPKICGKRVGVIRLTPEDHGLIGNAQPSRSLDYRVEHRLQVESRAADDLQHITRRGLIFERLLEIARALTQFIQEPRVFHCDDRLGCEVLQERDLLVGERSHFLTIDHKVAKQDFIFAQCYSKQGAANAGVSQFAEAQIVAI